MSDLFDFKPRATEFAVMGNPVAHSKSPQIHSLFAQQCQVNLSYTRIQVDTGGFNQAVSHFFAHGGGGLNVTLPYKVEAWKLCQVGENTLSPRAQVAQAVNTLAPQQDGRLFGDNTDGVGMVNDLTRNIGLTLSGKRILVVGAGGAVRGVLQPLLEENPGQLVLCNRTLDKAEKLAEVFEGRLLAKPLNFSPDAPFDLIINGTSSSIDGSLPGIDPNCIAAQSHCYDMMYASEPTIFMKWALSNGAHSADDGLGMLVEQAAESFTLWHGKRPDVPPVIAAIRKQ